MVSNEEKLLKERILEVLKSKKHSITSMALSDSDRVMLGRQIKGDNTIVPFRTLHRLLDMFPDISAEWLLMGEGPMYKSESNETNTGLDRVEDTVANQEIIDQLQARVAELEKDKHNMQMLIDAITIHPRM